MKLDKEAISEIWLQTLIQNQVLRLAMEKKKKKNNNNNKWWSFTTLGTASSKEHKCSSFRPSCKSCEKFEAPHINKDNSPLSVLMLFFTEILHLLVEQTNLYYEQFLDRQAGPSRRLPDITLPDMMTFIALALQMGHVLKDTLHDCWSRLRHALCFLGRP